MTKMSKRALARKRATNRARRMRLRNAEIVDAFMRKEPQSAIAKRYKLSVSRVSYILRAAGVSLSHEELRERIIISNRRINADPAFRAKRSEAVRQARSKWPDCPPDLLDDYRHLQRYMPALEARAALETRLAA